MSIIKKEKAKIKHNISIWCKVHFKNKKKRIQGNKNKVKMYKNHNKLIRNL